MYRPSVHTVHVPAISMNTLLDLVYNHAIFVMDEEYNSTKLEQIQTVLCTISTGTMGTGHEEIS